MTSSIFKQKLEYLSKKKVPFLLTCKGLSNKQTYIFFYFMGTLTDVKSGSWYQLMTSINKEINKQQYLIFLANDVFHPPRACENYLGVN